MISFKKRFIAFFLSLVLIFMLPVKEVKADAFALTSLSSGILLSEGGAAASAALSVAAPYALAIVATSLAVGLVYKNRTQIRDFVIGAGDYLSSVGQGIGEGIVEVGNGVVAMTSSAKASLLDYVSKVKSGRLYKVEVPLIDSITVPAGSKIRTKIVIPFSTNLNVSLTMLQVGDKHIKNVSFYYRIEGYNLNVGSCYKNGTIRFYDNKLYLGGRAVDLPIYRDIYVDLENQGSFDVEVGIVQDILQDKSICANVGSIPSYNDSVFSQPVDTYITPSNSKTANWDDVIGISGSLPSSVGSVSDSIPNVSNPDIPSMNLPSEVKLDFSPLEVSFKDKFPFCIPYDLYNSVKSLRAEPVAPKWEIPLPYDCGSIPIDFSIFTEWAMIIRWGVLIFFNLSLILVTRRLIC